MKSLFLICISQPSLLFANATEEQVIAGTYNLSKPIDEGTYNLSKPIDIIPYFHHHRGNEKSFVFCDKTLVALNISELLVHAVLITISDMIQYNTVTLKTNKHMVAEVYIGPVTKRINYPQWYIEGDKHCHFQITYTYSGDYDDMNGDKQNSTAHIHSAKPGKHDEHIESTPYRSYLPKTHASSNNRLNKWSSVSSESHASHWTNSGSGYFDPSNSNTVILPKHFTPLFKHLFPHQPISDFDFYEIKKSNIERLIDVTVKFGDTYKIKLAKLLQSASEVMILLIGDSFVFGQPFIHLYEATFTKSHKIGQYCHINIDNIIDYTFPGRKNDMHIVSRLGKDKDIKRVQQFKKPENEVQVKG